MVAKLCVDGLQTFFGNHLNRHVFNHCEKCDVIRKKCNQRLHKCGAKTRALSLV